MKEAHKKRIKEKEESLIKESLTLLYEGKAEFQVFASKNKAFAELSEEERLKKWHVVYVDEKL